MIFTWLKAIDSNFDNKLVVYYQILLIFLISQYYVVVSLFESLVIVYLRAT